MSTNPAGSADDIEYLVTVPDTVGLSGSIGVPTVYVFAPPYESELGAGFDVLLPEAVLLPPPQPAPIKHASRIKTQEINRLNWIIDARNINFPVDGKAGLSTIWLNFKNVWSGQETEQLFNTLESIISRK